MRLQDLKLAVRLLRKNPGFAAFAILTLGLGTGANTAIFTAVDKILVSPLPYGHADRLVMVWEDASFIGFAHNTPAPANFVDWKAQATGSFDGMAASRGRRFTIRGEGTPEELRGAAVTPDMFDVLQAKPIRGRIFTVDEDRNNAKVVVISHGLWTRRYGGEDSVIGRLVDLDGEPHEIIGVMPPGFFYPGRLADIWSPIGLDRIRVQRGNHFLRVVGRLKPGATIEQARAEMQTVARRLEAQYPQTNAKVGSAVEPLRDDITGSTRIALIALMGAAGCVLLIACANLANLLLARASGRTREMAVRLAIGADRASIHRQLLTESLVLSLLGGVAGAAYAAVSVKGLERMLPEGLATNLSIDGRSLAFAFAVSILSGVIFGLAPALQSIRLDLHSALKQTGRAGVSRLRAFTRDGLVVAEFAMAFVLLAGAGLLIQTIGQLRAVDLGFEPANILTGRIALLPTKYSNDERIRAFYREAMERLKTVPGVADAAFTSNLPYQTMGNTAGFDIEGRVAQRDFDALYREVSPNYLQMLGARLVAGRFYTDADHAGVDRVIVINETFQKLYWPNGDAVGKRIRYGPGSPWMTIIGVVRDLRERGAELAMKPAIYPSVLQEQRPGANQLVVRASQGQDAIQLAGAVRETLRAIDPGIPFSQVMTLDDMIDADTAERRYLMQILTVFAGLALALAAIGVYGVLSYAVSQRVREIGVRMALGADPLSITGMVAGRGLLLGAIGLAVGCVGAMFLLRLVQSVLYGVTANDPLILGSAAAILTIVAAAASGGPAWRASRVDPLTALHDD